MHCIKTIVPMNPCKCGWYGHPSGRCKCSEAEVHRYHARISGPLLDRIDLIVEVPALDYEELKRRNPAESSAEVRKRVNAARERQRARFQDRAMCNARMQPKELRAFCATDAECDALLKAAFDTMNLSARSYDRILRVARSIADLEGAEHIRADHIAEAIQYRTYELKA